MIIDESKIGKGLTRVFSNPDIESYEIVCYNAEDYTLLREYLIPAD